MLIVSRLQLTKLIGGSSVKTRIWSDSHSHSLWISLLKSMPNSIIAANPSYRREVLKAGDLFFIQKAFIEI